MTTRNPIPGDPHGAPHIAPHGDSELPAHLAALAADLDRLAAAEATLAGPSLEDRLFVRTRSAALHQGMTPEVRRMNDAMQADAARTLAEVPAGLEDRIFDQTVGIIRGEHAVVGNIGRAGMSGFGVGRWTARLALAASLALAAGGVWLLLNNTTPQSPEIRPGIAVNPPSPEVKIAAVPEDIQTLLASTEAEEKFIALFALSNDSLSADIRSAALDAEQLSGSLFPENSDTPTVGG